jgi:tRNA 2-selenouridine synthase
MALEPASLPALLAHGFDTVIDVRSPAEYAEDHVPDAVSMPVLSDAERAVVGTIYKQESPFGARKLGAALVARNAAFHLTGALATMEGSWRPLVYCWRGGQRSGSFASILSQVGWRTDTLAGGYRTYRRLVVEMLHDRPLPHRLVLLDGYTGTAKTEILGRLAARGTQVLDLEGLARHRGSLFGPIAGGQPAQKAFETAIARALLGADPARPVVVEAESAKVGDLLVPPSLWAAMCAAPRIVVEAPAAARVEYLTRAYGDIVADRARLECTLDQLQPFVARELLDAWRGMAGRGAYSELAAGLVEHHYDPRYARQRKRHGDRLLGTVQAAWLGAADLERLAASVEALLPDAAEALA